MAPNWDEPTGVTSSHAIYSHTMLHLSLLHERQLHPLSTLPTGVTSPCIPMARPCNSAKMCTM